MKDAGAFFFLKPVGILMFSCFQAWEKVVIAEWLMGASGAYAVTQVLTTGCKCG